MDKGTFLVKGTKNQKPTLASGIDVGQGINVGLENLAKRINVGL